MLEFGKHFGNLIKNKVNKLMALPTDTKSWRGNSHRIFVTFEEVCQFIYDFPFSAFSPSPQTILLRFKHKKMTITSFKFIK